MLVIGKHRHELRGMKRSDLLIATAAAAGIPAEAAGKRTVTLDGMTTVCIFGKECMKIDRKGRKVTVMGDTVPSRKSTRLINTVLETFTDIRVTSSSGRWYVTGKDRKEKKEFTSSVATAEVNIPLPEKA